MSNIIGIMYQHEHDEKEYQSVRLSETDQVAIMAILAKYETTNAQFDDSIRGNLQVIDIDE